MGHLAKRLEKDRGSTEAIIPFGGDAVIGEAGAAKQTPDAGGARDQSRGLEIAAPKISAWDHVLLARHASRPRMLDYVSRIFDDLFELHGDRAVGDDPAMIAGIGRFQGETVMVVGQQKGVSTEEKVERNFGMAHPDGYRKAMRIYSLAERFKLPVISFVDTPAAHPGIEAEQRGQGPAIAQGIMQSLCLKSPIFCVIIGEGGSGGALAIAVGDHIAIFEHAFYVICPPERCAEILWRDVDKKKLAAQALKLTAKDLLALGVVDSVMPEPGGGAHRNPDAAAQVLAEEIEQFLSRQRSGIYSPEKRQAKFRSMGVWYEHQVLDATEAVD